MGHQQRNVPETRDNAGRLATYTESPPKWKFPSGANLLFPHLEHETTKTAWDGSQIAMLGFDELIHFTESQFWYFLIGRNRSTCGVKPYVRRLQTHKRAVG